MLLSPSPLVSACLVIILCLSSTCVARQTEEEKCRNFVRKENNGRLKPSDCHYVTGQYVKCVIRFTANAPLDVGLDPDEQRVDYGVQLEYTFTLLLKELNLTNDKDGEGKLHCLLVQSISFRRAGHGNGQSPSRVSLASRIFSVVANAEMVSEGVDLLEPVVVGVANIHRKCLSGQEKNTSSCILSIGVSANPRIPGSEEDIYTGSVDFSITAFGYSHLSGLRTDIPGIEDAPYIRTFRDRTKWGKALLTHLPGINITSLILPGNRWKTLSNVTFPYLPKLELLDLSRNAFGIFDSGLLRGSKHLRELNFSESQLKKIPTFIENQLNLTLLNLGGNTFQYDLDINGSALNSKIHKLTLIEKLNISGFTIKYFANYTLPKLPHLKELDASKCEIFYMEGDSFHYQPVLEKIDLSSNELNILPPDLFAKLKYLKRVDLSQNRFLKGQGFIFYFNKSLADSGVEYLDMSSNSLDSPANLIADGAHVKEINLRKNILKNVEGVDFQNVDFLDLSSNPIPSISYASAKVLQNVKLVNLSDNQFNCDSCDLPFFQGWLNDNGRNKLTSSYENLTCALPPDLRRLKTKILEARYNEELCRSNLPVVLGSTFSSIALLAALVAGVLYIYRFEAAYVLHLIRVRRRVAKEEGKPHSECIYDAFVSYSGHDRNWVLRVLQPELEESAQKYQLCLHDRNFPLGGFITQNIVDSIDKSRKTILIVSENFVDSQWCRWEMEMANHKLFTDSRDFLVLIELDRLDRKNVPRHLRFLMDTRTYLEWPTESLAVLHDQSIEVTEKDPEAIASGIPEQAMQIFWKRLREALGDSLYTREQKALKEAQLVVQKSKQRDVDNIVLRYRHCEEFQEEKEML